MSSFDAKSVNSAQISLEDLLLVADQVHLVHAHHDVRDAAAARR